MTRGGRRYSLSVPARGRTSSPRPCGRPKAQRSGCRSPPIAAGVAGDCPRRGHRGARLDPLDLQRAAIGKDDRLQWRRWRRLRRLRRSRLGWWRRCRLYWSRHRASLAPDDHVSDVRLHRACFDGRDVQRAFDQRQRRWRAGRRRRLRNRRLGVGEANGGQQRNERVWDMLLPGSPICGWCRLRQSLPRTNRTTRPASASIAGPAAPGAAPQGGRATHSGLCPLSDPRTAFQPDCAHSSAPRSSPD